MSAARDNEVTHDLSALAWVHDELRVAGSRAQVAAPLPEGSRRARRLRRRHGRRRRCCASRASRCTRASARSSWWACPPPAHDAARRAKPRCSKLRRACRAGIDAGCRRQDRARSFALLDYLGRLLAGKPVSPAGAVPAVPGAAGAGRRRPRAPGRPVDGRLALARAAGAPMRGAATRRRRRTQSLLEAETLALMRGRDAGAAQRMSDLLAGLAAGSRRSRCATLWQLAAAVFEAPGQGPAAARSLRQARWRRACWRSYASPARASRARPTGWRKTCCSSARRPCAGRRHAAASAPGRGAQGLRSERQCGRSTTRARVSAASIPALLAQARKRVAAAKDAWSAVAGGELQRCRAWPSSSRWSAIRCRSCIPTASRSPRRCCSRRRRRCTPAARATRRTGDGSRHRRALPRSVARGPGPRPTPSWPAACSAWPSASTACARAHRPSRSKSGWKSCTAASPTARPWAAWCRNCARRCRELEKLHRPVLPQPGAARSADPGAGPAVGDARRAVGARAWTRRRRPCVRMRDDVDATDRHRRRRRHAAQSAPSTAWPTTWARSAS